MTGLNFERTWRALVNAAVGAALIAMPVVAAAAAPPANTQTGAAQATTQKAADDADFVKRAAAAAQTELDAAKRAIARSGPVEVKTFAERMVEDHTVSLAELMSLSPTPPPTVESAPPSTASAQTVQASPTPPPTAPVAPEDRAYLDESIATHEMLVALYTAQSTDGKDERLKLWAQQKLPMLREHLELGRTVRARLGATTPR